MSDKQPTIHRAELPVDDRWHILAVPGPIVSWGCRRPDVVEFWFWANRPDPAGQHVLRVYGTGHPITGGENAKHLATLPVPGAPLIWHVIEWTGRPGRGVWPPSAGVLEGVLRMSYRAFPEPDLSPLARTWLGMDQP